MPPVALLFRFVQAVCGLVVGGLGVTSLLTSLLLVFASFRDVAAGARLIMAGFMFVLGEVFLAFGVVCVLLAIRLMVGPRLWVVVMIDKAWKHSMRYALVLPAMGFAFAALAALLRLMGIVI